MININYELDQSTVKASCGIYAIRIDSHLYIGSTKRTLWKRLKEHEYDLKQNKHQNHRMQEWFNKGTTIVFMALEYCSSKYVCQREQYYIDKYKPDINIVQHVAKY